MLSDPTLDQRRSQLQNAEKTKTI